MQYIKVRKLILGLVYAGVLFASIGGCSDSSNRTSQGPAQATVPEMVQEDPLDFLERSLSAQVDAVENGTLDCEGLVNAYAERIAVEDEGPEGINAMLSMVDDPAALARQVDATRGDSPSLQCAIIVIKDNIDMAGLPTTAGSLALANNLTNKDAPLVARLREQGALLLGKTNLSEWANYRGTGSTNGWSSLGGQTRNGFDGESDPCGSSSGSAAAVAAGMVTASVGTETMASIVCPASSNGVVGMKPTIGLVSRTDVIPVSFTFDTAGPITRTVRDAARMLSVMAGLDQADTATMDIPADMDLNFDAQLDGVTLDGLRIGVIENWGLAAPDDVEPIDALFKEELVRIETAGATLVPVALNFYAQAFSDEVTISASEFKPGLNDYLSRHAVPGQITNLTELILFNQDNADQVMPFFGQELLQAAESLQGLDNPPYQESLERFTRMAGEEGILKVMLDNDLDALISPTWGPAPPITYPSVFPVPTRIVLFAAWARYPHITVPMGLVDGLPVGLSVVAGPWQDATVLSIAYAYEQLE